MSTLPLTQPHLPLIAACAKALASDRPFNDRVEQALQVLRTLVYFYDARLVYWREHAETQTHAVTLEGTLSAPWDEAHVTEAQSATSYWHEKGSVAVAHAGGAVATTEFRSHLLPIVWNDTSVGFIEMRTASDVLLSSGELATLQAVLPLFAAQIDIAISQMPLTILDGDRDDAPIHEDALVQVSQQLDLAQLLSRLRQDFDPPLPLHSLLPLILSRGMEYTGAEAGSIMYVDHDQQELELIEAVGYTIAQLPDGQTEHKRHRWSWENGIAGKVARSTRPLLVREVTQDVDYFYAEKPDVRAKLAIPITVDGRAHAVMILDSTRSHAFGDRESALALGVAEAAVQPLRRSLRYQELLERSTQLSQVFNSIPSGMALLDRHGQVLRHNPAFLSIWGLTTAQVGPGFRIPFDLLALLMPRFHDSAAFSDFCTNGQAKRDLKHSLAVRLRNPHQDLNILSVPTRDTSEQITGRLWVIHDQTREKEADRLKSEFTSIVSHELKTPLTSIMGYAELLLSREFTRDEQRNFLQILNQQAENLNNLVNDMLDFARIESNTVRINRWTVPLQELTSDLVRQMRRQPTFDKHTIVTDVPADIPPVHADKERVRQVMTNLLTNAAKYAPEGGTITLRIRELNELPDLHPSGRFVLISVSDEGIGISADHLQRIWDRFVRVDNSNTKSIGGTGLGLSIVKGLVELQGGRVWATSILGKGSTFSFTLPMATDSLRK
jgi:signal transduction histidine kinase